MCGSCLDAWRRCCRRPLGRLHHQSDVTAALAHDNLRHGALLAVLLEGAVLEPPFDDHQGGFLEVAFGKIDSRLLEQYADVPVGLFLAPAAAARP